ncbi:MAG: tetratricopeptide repeat protein [Chloroflexota bacterium]
MAPASLTNLRIPGGWQRGRRAIMVALIGVALLSSLAALWLQLSAQPNSSRSPLQATTLPRDSGPGDQGANQTSAIDRLVRKAQSSANARPTDPEAQSQLGFAFLQAARETADPSAYGRAELAFNAAIALDPANVDALIGQGSLALSRHEFRSALDFGQRALALNPSIASTYGVIADAQIELGRYPDAIRTVQHMVDLRPDIASYSRVSYLRELHGDLDGAIQAMEKAVSAAGPASENTEYVRVQLGNLYFSVGRIDDAQLTYQRSLVALPNFRYALRGLARVEAARGNLPGAIDLYQRATAQVPLPELLIGLGEAMQANGQPVDAADQYALVEAEQRLFAANGVRTDLELASFFADHGDPLQAVTLAIAAYRERPSVFGADTLAWALHRAGRSQEAALYLAQALRLGTRDSRILYHAGMIEIALGEIDAARDHLQAALALNPAFSPLDATRAEQALEGLGR